MRNTTVVAFISTLLYAGNDSYLLKLDSNVKNNVTQTLMAKYRPVNSVAIPDHYDWREQNMVSPVKNQLTCNACWAFCVVANIESHLKIYRNVEETLSDQFLIDCDDDQKGCGNASIINTFADIVTKLGGVLRDKDYYPYASRPLQCRWQRDGSKDIQLKPTLGTEYPTPVPVVGFRRVLPDEEIMAQFVYQYGPLAAAINAASMATYQGDIDEPSDEDCNPKDLDHSILIVGYSVFVSKETVRKIPYWIIKNSWGTEWGDNGFYYLVRGRNACGIASDVSFAFVN